MKVTKTAIIQIIIICVGLIFTDCKQKEKVSNQDAVTESHSDSKIVLEDLEGMEIDLDDYKGKVIVMNFWATWCKPCISEMPSFDRLIHQLGNEDYIFLAASDENIDKVKKFVAKNPHDFRYVHMKTNVYELGISVLPTTYIINRDGKIIDKVIGAKEWDSAESIQKLKIL